MRLRQAYEYALIECNKLKAPALLLEDYIYLFNKAIQQYVNSVYNRAEYNQQSSDDLGWLQQITVLHSPMDLRTNGEYLNKSNEFGDNIFTFELPDDYLHLLNCKAEISGSNVTSNRCGSSITNKTTAVNCFRLTANLEGGIMNNYYNKPSHKRPYYYIANRNDNDTIIIENSDKDNQNPDYGYSPVYSPIKESETPTYRFYDLKERFDRTSHQSPLFIEIHLGDSDYTVNRIQLTYLRSPMYVSMTQEDLLSVEDNTQVLEFPDYVCYEIINIYVRLLLENASDPRLSTVAPINQSIAVG